MTRVAFFCLSALLACLAGQTGGGLATAATAFTANEVISVKPDTGHLGGTSASISADGRYVAFVDSSPTVYVRDRLLGVTELVTVGFYAGPPGAPTENIELSADGRFVVFDSSDPNPLNPNPDIANPALHVYVRDRLTQQTEILSTLGADPKFCTGSEPAISADGRYVAFHSEDAGWGDISPCFYGGEQQAMVVYDRQTDTTERVDLSPGGDPPQYPRCVVGDPIGCATGDQDMEDISADGRYVVFTNFAGNLVAGDTNKAGDVFVRDRLLGTTERVSVSSAEEQADWGSAGCAGGCRDAQISADGRFVAFNTFASNLVSDDTNETEDVFVRDRLAGTTELISRNAGGTIGNDFSGFLSLDISGDGRFVTFSSQADNLVSGDTNENVDVFVRDRSNNSIRRVLGYCNQQAHGESDVPTISADGRYVAFQSFADNLILDAEDPEPPSGAPAVFVNDRDAVLAACSGTGTIVVEKQTLPDGDPTTFTFSGDAAGTIGDGETIVVSELEPGNYTSAEGQLPEGWQLYSISCDDPSEDTTYDDGRQVTFHVAAGETIRCVFTNTKRASVSVKKTTNGVVDPSRAVTFVLTGAGLEQPVSRSTFGDADGLLDFGSANLLPGSTYTVCEAPVPAGFTSFWKLDGEIVTPINPDASHTPPEDIGTRCYDFDVSPGQRRGFEVDNSRPGGDPRTIGYWKNWNRCTSGNQAATAAKNGGAPAGVFLVEDLLPQVTGDFSIKSCLQTVKLLSKQDQSGKSKAGDAAYELGAQLLAARFNLAAGAETCVAAQQAVVGGQALLDQINFTGTGDYLGSKSKDARRAQALNFAQQIDRYNNGGLC